MQRLLLLLAGALGLGGLLLLTGAIPSNLQDRWMSSWSDCLGTGAACLNVSSTPASPASAPCRTVTVNAQGVSNAGITVDATAGGITVLAASTTRCGAVLENLQGGGDALCGPTTITVTTTVGFYLPAGQSLKIDQESSQAWKCIRQAATNATLYVVEATP